MNVYATDFFALFNEETNCFFNCLCARAHGDKNEFCIRSTGVIEQVVFTARNFTDFLHVAFCYIWYDIIEFIKGFTVLHECFSWFAEGNSFRIIRVHAAFTEFCNGLHVQHRTEVFVRNAFNLLDFMRCTETIEEVEDRNTTGNSRSMNDCRQIHNFLNTRFYHHADTSAAHSHRVVMAGKMVYPFVATVRDATWNTPGSNSLEILNMLESMIIIP